MTTVQFEVPARLSETFNTAVYRFIEVQLSAFPDELAILKTEPHGPVHRKDVTLWSEQAARDFEQFWRRSSKC